MGWTLRTSATHCQGAGATAVWPAGFCYGKQAMRFLPYPIAMIGTLVVLAAAWIVNTTVRRQLVRRVEDARERYRRHQILSTSMLIVVVIALIVLWGRLLPYGGAFLGLIVAGVAVTLREPLLAIAGRLAILANRMYSAGDRIEVNGIKGDVIDVGVLYTRLMELGSWIGGDLVTGRIVQFSNSAVFAHALFNYTRDFPYIWDEIQIPVTYDSDLQVARGILLRVGQEYTGEFLQGAETELERMGRYFLVPILELNPTVFMAVTSNWVELSLRYVVDPKRRRVARTFIYEEVFRLIREDGDITVASQTMDLTVHSPQRGGSPPHRP